MGEFKEQFNEINGLKKEIQDLLKEARASNLKLFEAASKLDNAVAKLLMPTIEETEEEGTGVTGKRKRSTAIAETMGEAAETLPPGKRGCGNCGKPGHRRTSCPEPNKKANRPMGKRACSKCGESGHRAPKCPN